MCRIIFMQFCELIKSFKISTSPAFTKFLISIIILYLSLSNHLGLIPTVSASSSVFFSYTYQQGTGIEYPLLLLDIMLHICLEWLPIFSSLAFCIKEYTVAWNVGCVRWQQNWQYSNQFYITIYNVNFCQFYWSNLYHDTNFNKRLNSS